MSLVFNMVGGGGGGIKLTKKGRVENCIIESCQACTGGSAGHGGGLYVDAGSVVTGCIVKNCYTTQNGDIKGIGVYIANGTLEHSLVFGSKRTKSMAKPCYGAVYPDFPRSRAKPQRLLGFCS